MSNLNSTQSKHIESLLEKIEQQEVEIKALKRFEKKCALITDFIFQLENAEACPSVDGFNYTIYRMKTVLVR